MAKPSTLRLWRLRLAGWRRPPWAIAVLFAGDIVELGASIALAAASPPPPGPKAPYPVFDVPPPAPTATLGVAFLGIVIGLVWGASLVAELVMMYRRVMIRRWKRPARASI
jgi:hypothetical protein